MSNGNNRRDEITSVMDAIKGIATAVSDIWDVWQRNKGESPTERDTKKSEKNRKITPKKKDE